MAWAPACLPCRSSLRCIRLRATFTTGHRRVFCGSALKRGGVLRGGGQRGAALSGRLALVAAGNRRRAGPCLWPGHLRVEFEQPDVVAARPDGILSCPGNLFSPAARASARGLLGGAELRPGLLSAGPPPRVAVAAAAIYYLMLRPAGAVSLCGRRPARGFAAGGVQPALLRHACWCWGR